MLDDEEEPENVTDIIGGTEEDRIAAFHRSASEGIILQGFLRKQSPTKLKGNISPSSIVILLLNRHFVQSTATSYFHDASPSNVNPLPTLTLTLTLALTLASP